jgi:hypothetical protein
MAMSGITRTTTDHDLIRKWVEARGGHPARVPGTERSGAGLLRVQFPESEGANELEPISWTDFFAKLDEKNLAFLYQETTSDGELSRFNRFVNR